MSQDKTKKPGVVQSSLYRSTIKRMIECAAALHPHGEVTPKQKEAIRYFANRSTEDFSKRSFNTAAPDTPENDNLPKDSVKY